MNETTKMPESGDSPFGMTQIDAIVRRVRHSATDDAEVEAVFRWVSDAVAWVDAKVQQGPWSRDQYTIENLSGRRIRGATAHGYAILDALEKADRAPSSPDSGEAQ